MQSAPRPAGGKETEGLLMLATVIDHLEPDQRLLRCSKVPDGEEIWAEVALGTGTRPAVGERVLIAKDDGMRYYILGVLAGTSHVPAAAECLVARDGSRAERIKEEGEERLRLSDRRGRLLFEYRPDTNSAVLNLPDGDLQIRAPNGNIDLISGRSLRLTAVNRLNMTASEEINLALGGKGNGAVSGIQLARQGLALTSELLKLRAAKSDMVVGSARFRGRRLEATVSRARLVFDQLESIAERVVTRARSFYQVVEKLHHTRAGRLRALVEGTYDVSGHRLILKARNLVKVDGDKIHLG